MKSTVFSGFGPTLRFLGWVKFFGDEIMGYSMEKRETGILILKDVRSSMRRKHVSRHQWLPKLQSP
jgi:hypothetical protein